MNRRDFLKNSAMAGGAVSALGVSGCAKPETKPAAENTFGNLKPIKDVKPISLDERKKRIAKAQDLMSKNKIDAIIIEPGSTFSYFVGFSWWKSERFFGAILPAKGDFVYICPAFEEDRAKELIKFGNDIRTWEEDESPFTLTTQYLKEKGISSGKIGFEENTRFFITDEIRKEAGGAQIVSATPVTAGCRMIKSPAELALMKKANEGMLQAYKAVFNSLEKGMTQYDINSNLSKAFRALGLSGGAGVQLGEYTAFPHGSIKPQKLKEGDVVLIDGSGSLEDYHGDITRTTVFGEPTKLQRERWNLVKKAQSKAFATIKPGVPCGEIDAAARNVINSAGYGPGYKNFWHRLGHGIGMDVHEWTYLVKGNKTPLQPGMCFSNEPGIYVVGEFGIRSEDCWHVTENGYEAFTPQSPSIDNPVS
ncbi:MAG TPA: M24 family metallopeptidase [Ignavibacteriaceae bacterium]|nr:M24 family metallopeptidase [Ignavibacteriaceae bacterium]